MSKIIDITGQKFGRLTVLEYIPNYISKSGKVYSKWKCICDCQKNKQEKNKKYTYVRSNDLRNGRTVSCGCFHQEIRHTVKIIHPAIRVEDLIGQKFNHLTVIKRGENTNDGKARWWCECDCKNPELVLIRARNLKNGNTTSCGCVHKKIMSKICKERFEQNKYDLISEEYGIGFTSNPNQDGINEFWFDKEDYDLIKNYHWNFGSKYGVQTNIYNTTLLLHRLIMGIEDRDQSIQVDHIKHKRYDNRKSELRIVNNSQNGMNNGIQVNNKTGVTGVCFDTRNNKYMAYITKNNKQYYLGYYNTLEEATKIREVVKIK